MIWILGGIILGLVGWNVRQLRINRFLREHLNHTLDQPVFAFQPMLQAGQGLLWEISLPTLEAKSLGDPILQQAWQNIYPPDREAIEAERALVLGGNGSDFCQEYRIVCPNQTLRFVSVKGQVLRQLDGTPIKIFGLMVDVTKDAMKPESIQQLQQEIQQRIANEARYRAIIENQDELIMRWSFPGFELTYANEACCKHFSTSLERLMGQDFRTLIHPDDRDWVSAKLITLGPTNLSIVWQNRILLPSLEVRWQQWTSHIIFDDQKEILEIQAVGRDITENKLIEEALERIESRSRALLEGIPDSMFLLDRQGVFLDFRSRMPVVAEPGRVLYSNLREFPEFADIADKILQSIEETLVTGVLQSFEYESAQAEGVHYYEARITASGQQEALMVIRDITDRKRAEEAFLALTREQETNQLQQHFFAMISHEFRTPLNVMRMSIGILESANPEWLTEKISRNLQRIKSASDRILDTIDNMITIYQVETEFFEPSWEAIKVIPFCQSIIEEIQSTSEYVITLYNDQPQRPLYSDVRLLRCILANLLTNAMKYSEGEVEVEIRHEPEKLRLSVRDRGIGIPAEDLKRIFEPFYRASNVGNVSGSGLGLSVVKKCVEVCGGTIQAMSKEGAGTTFLVILPLHPPLH